MSDFIAALSRILMWLINLENSFFLSHGTTAPQNWKNEHVLFFAWKAYQRCVFAHELPLSMSLIVPQFSLPTLTAKIREAFWTLITSRGRREKSYRNAQTSIPSYKSILWRISVLLVLLIRHRNPLPHHRNRHRNRHRYRNRIVHRHHHVRRHHWHLGESSKHRKMMRTMFMMMMGVMARMIVLHLIALLVFCLLLNFCKLRSRKLRANSELSWELSRTLLHLLCYLRDGCVDNVLVGDVLDGVRGRRRHGLGVD